MINDTELLHRCIAGDQDAWRRFLTRYRAILYASILRTLATRNEASEIAEDVFQDVLLKLLADDCKALRSFQGRAQVSTWLARIAINATIDAVRRKRARRELDPEDHGDEDRCSSAEEILKRIPVDAGILESISSNDLAHRLLEQLDEQDCLILQMYFYGGLKEREIAELVEIPLNTISSRKSRALEKLRSAARELLRVSSDGTEPGKESDPAGA
ncbi:MAG: RNA polymerase sigma factor [Candidatus Eisenbacteria sp.]|nr:RNA polymerase sigma factor [Candidatus Eisenbacteria bacterium]